MIKCLSAYTTELSSADDAKTLILSQIGAWGPLLKSSLGIVSCSYDYIESGIAAEVCEALPFATVGTVSTLQACSMKSGAFLFALLVLTSDEVVFTAQLSPSFGSEPYAAIQAAYRGISYAEVPALILSFAPFTITHSGDDILAALNAVSGGIPCFGTLATDDSGDLFRCLALFNGGAYSERMALVGIHGQISPRFYVATLSEDKILGKPALITKSDSHILKEVNGRPILSYFEELGLDGTIEKKYAMSSLPFVMDYGDGTPPALRALLTLTPERHALCSGFMQEGATMYIGILDKEDILFTTQTALEEALEHDKAASCLLCYSCSSRSTTLGSRQMAEMELTKNLIGNRVPFLMAASGGELCPTGFTQDALINRYHSNTFIICAL